MRYIQLLLLAAIALLALGAAACNDDDSNDSASADEIARVEELALTAQITSALNTYRIEDMHNLDDDSQKASEIDAGWSGRIARMHQATLATHWPEELATMADDFATNLDAAGTALEEEDFAAYKGSIGKAHAAWHDLDPAAWDHISGEQHGDTHHGASPTATEGTGGG